MATSPLENRSDAIDPLRHWDQPDGLGWQLWRRVHATGLSTQQTRRDVGRLRSHILMDRAPLAADIRRRWGLGQETAGYQFPLDFPLFHARFPLFYAHTPHQPLPSTLESLHRSADVRSVSRLSRQTEHPVQRSIVTNTVFLQRSSDISDLDQMLRLSLHSQGAGSLGETAVIATHSNVEASSRRGLGLRTADDPQTAAQWVIRRSPLVSNSVNAQSDVNTFALTTASSKHQRRELNSPFIRPRDMLVLENLMPQRLVEHAVQYLPLNRSTEPVSPALGLPDRKSVV